jgi:hypothetical protein
MKTITIILLCQLAMSFLLPSAAVSAIPVTRSAIAAPGVSLNNKNISKILPVLENRVVDLRLRRKTIDKLATLSDEKIRLISSLCEKIAQNSSSAGSDIAFSLVSILIILS